MDTVTEYLRERVACGDMSRGKAINVLVTLSEMSLVHAIALIDTGKVEREPCRT